MTVTTDNDTTTLIHQEWKEVARQLVKNKVLR